MIDAGRARVAPNGPAPAAAGAAMVPRRKPWPGFLWRAGFALLVLLGVGAYLTERFRLGYDDQDRQCLPPHRWFLIDRHDRDPARDALLAFAARGLAPYFDDGQTLIKRAAGLPGDRIQVGPQTVRINGEAVAEGLALAGTLARPPSAFFRDEPVPPGHLWMMGATADSFDSRYWGFLPHRQVIGRAYGLW
ncbi:signal peptidase I [Thiococcus pfennigii]|uniref:signal peptidase I n=1 Tax=Thiococcus pfennigii TaxID=1057 RepID=UPI001F5B5965|nr:signal peptidase I [Thiococcus pfennigii]